MIKCFIFLVALLPTVAHASRASVVHTDVQTVSGLSDGRPVTNVRVSVTGAGVARINVLSPPGDETAPPDTVVITTRANHTCLWRLALPAQDKLGVVSISGVHMRLERNDPSEDWRDKHGNRWKVTKGSPPLSSSASVDCEGALIWKQGTWTFLETGKRTWERISSQKEQ